LAPKINRFDLIRNVDPTNGKLIFSLTVVDPVKYASTPDRNPWVDLAETLAALCRLPGAEEALKIRGLRAEFGEETGT